METTHTNLQNGGDFVPVTWKKWYALTRGVKEGWITPGIDDAALKDVIINLEAESAMSIKGFPIDILELEHPSLAMEEIGKAARIIAEAYSEAKPAIESFPDSIADRFGVMAQDCETALGLKSVFDSSGDSCTIDDIVSLHGLASGHSFQEMALDIFVDLTRINSSIGSRPYKLVPLPGGEMSFHTLLVILMLKSHLFSDISNPLEKGLWSKLYSGKVAWSESAESNSWINNYLYSEPFALDEGILPPDSAGGFIPTDSDRALLEGFLERKCFDRLCDKDELISRGFSTYTLDDIKILSKVARMTDDRHGTLLRLYRLLLEETNYLLRTRERESGLFLSEEDAHQVFMHDRFLQDELGLLEGRLESIFLGKDAGGRDILSLLDQLDDFRFHVPLSEKPVVNSTMIREIIDSCVRGNRAIKSIVREAIDDERLVGEAAAERPAKIPPSSGADSGSGLSGTDAVLAELKSGGYIENDGSINLSGAKFARHLVKSGYVKPGKSWKPWFRNPEWIRFSEDGFISNGEIQELTKELNWKPFDGVFKDKDGKTLSSSNLSKYFSDGDSSYTKRNALFLQIYHRLSHKLQG